MLMKQHSYAFYNGYLSTVYTKRLFFVSKLQQLEKAAPSETASCTVPTVSSLSTSHLGDPPSASAQRRHSLAQTPSDEESDIDKIASAIASHEPLDDEQIHVFERILKWEVDALADELRGTTSDAGRAYPHNLTFLGHYQWIPLPTLVYELEYPRSESISWAYVAEKLVAMVGVLFVMNQVAQYSICEQVYSICIPFSCQTWTFCALRPLEIIDGSTKLTRWFSHRPRRHEDGADEGRRALSAC